MQLECTSALIDVTFVEKLNEDKLVEVVDSGRHACVSLEGRILALRQHATSFLKNICLGDENPSIKMPLTFFDLLQALRENSVLLNSDPKALIAWHRRGLIFLQLYSIVPSPDAFVYSNYEHASSEPVPATRQNLLAKEIEFLSRIEEKKSFNLLMCNFVSVLLGLCKKPDDGRDLLLEKLINMLRLFVVRCRRNQHYWTLLERGLKLRYTAAEARVYLRTLEDQLSKIFEIESHTRVHTHPC